MLEPEIEVHARGPVFLHAEAVPVGEQIPGRAVRIGTSDRVSAGLRRLFEVALAAVLLKCFFRHVGDLGDEVPCNRRGQCPSRS